MFRSSLGVLWIAAALAFGGEAAPSRPPPRQVFLDGAAFPAREPFDPILSAPRRTLYVSSSASRQGDGSRARPWNALQEALCALLPGDRLVLLPGRYRGSFHVDGACRNGTEEGPIQVLAESGAELLAGRDGVAVVAVKKAHWSFRGLEIVPGNRRFIGFSVAGPEAHDVVFDRGIVRGGFGTGIAVAAESERVTISNSRIQDIGDGTEGSSDGILVSSAARDLTIVNNEIIDDFGSAVRVEGPHGKGHQMHSLVEKLSITGNRLGSRGAPAVSLRGCRNVRISRNTIWSSAAAVRVEPNVRDVVVEQNHAAAPAGIHAGGPSQKGPRGMLVSRNYLEGDSSGESVGVRAESGSRVRIFNNVIDRYANGLRVLASPPEGEGFSIANNLILEASGLSFDVSHPEAATHFDHNVFASGAGQVRGRLGQRTVDLVGYLAGGAMPASRVARRVELTNRDLGRIAGVALIDAGTALRGISHEGGAPDVGVSEK